MLHAYYTVYMFASTPDYRILFNYLLTEQSSALFYETRHKWRTIICRYMTMGKNLACQNQRWRSLSVCLTRVRS